MRKQEAIELLGGTVSAVAAEVGVSPAAVTQWPDDLPSRIRDRVQAALWRRQEREAKGPAEVPTEPQAA